MLIVSSIFIILILNLYYILGTPEYTLARPVLPHNRSNFDRLIDYLVGDGPSNRYALICRQCECHNGMALKEEFEYLGEYNFLKFANESSE